MDFNLLLTNFLGALFGSATIAGLFALLAANRRMRFENASWRKDAMLKYYAESMSHLSHYLNFLKQLSEASGEDEIKAAKAPEGDYTLISARTGLVGGEELRCHMGHLILQYLDLHDAVSDYLKMLADGGAGNAEAIEERIKLEKMTSALDQTYRKMVSLMRQDLGFQNPKDVKRR